MALSRKKELAAVWKKKKKNGFNLKNKINSGNDT